MSTPLHPSDVAYFEDLATRIDALPSPERDTAIASVVAFVDVMTRLATILEPNDMRALLAFMQGAHPSTWPAIAQVAEQYETWRQQQQRP
jgi:hypothetical protein